MSVLLQEPHNEVHCDLLKWESAFFCSNVVEWYFLLVGYDFVLLASCTAFYVVCDPLPHSCPWQDFGGFPDRLILSWVSSGRVVVDEGHEVPFRGVWDLRRGGVDEEFWFEEGLIPIVVVSLVRVGRA